MQLKRRRLKWETTKLLAKLRKSLPFDPLEYLEFKLPDQKLPVDAVD